jgi:hypothetical protein
MGKEGIKSTYSKAEVDALVAALEDEIAELTPFDPFAQFIEFLPWVSLDGWNIGGSEGATVDLLTPFLEIYPPNIADTYAAIMTKSLWSNLIEVGKRVTIEFPLVWIWADTAQLIHLRCTSDPTLPPTEIAAHFGWKILNGDIYASNADGATQTIIDTGVDVDTATPNTRLKMVYTPGTDIKFYINDVLVATHTTNLPAMDSSTILIFVKTTENDYKGLDIDRLLIQKAYA